MREIRTLRAMWRGLETGSRFSLHGHEGGNSGHSQGMSQGLPRQPSTLPRTRIGDSYFISRQTTKVASTGSLEFS